MNATKSSDLVRQKLGESIAKLEEAGILQPGEIAIDDAAAVAQSDAGNAEQGFHGLMHLLRALDERRENPFSRLAFFPIQAETTQATVVAMVREFARLSGQADSIVLPRVTGLEGEPIEFASVDEFPSPNAKAEFDLHGEPFTVPFVMYSRQLPVGLFDELAIIFNRRVPHKRFVSAYCDLLVVAIVENTDVPVIERLFPDEFEPYASDK